MLGLINAANILHKVNFSKVIDGWLGNLDRSGQARLKHIFFFLSQQSDLFSAADKKVKIILLQLKIIEFHKYNNERIH